MCLTKFFDVVAVVVAVYAAALGTPVADKRRSSLIGVAVGGGSVWNVMRRGAEVCLRVRFPLCWCVDGLFLLMMQGPFERYWSQPFIDVVDAGGGAGGVCCCSFDDGKIKITTIPYYIIREIFLWLCYCCCCAAFCDESNWIPFVFGIELHVPNKTLNGCIFYPIFGFILNNIRFHTHSLNYSFAQIVFFYLSHVKSFFIVKRWFFVFAFSCFEIDFGSVVENIENKLKDASDKRYIGRKKIYTFKISTFWNRVLGRSWFDRICLTNLSRVSNTEGIRFVSVIAYWQ